MKPVYWQQGLAFLVIVAVYMPLLLVMPDILFAGIVPWVIGMLAAHVCLGWLDEAPTFRRGHGRITGYVTVFSFVTCIMIATAINPWGP